MFLTAQDTWINVVHRGNIKEWSNSWLFFLLECHTDLPWMRGSLRPSTNQKTAYHYLGNEKNAMKSRSKPRNCQPFWWKLQILQAWFSSETKKDMYFPVLRDQTFSFENVAQSFRLTIHVNSWLLDFKCYKRLIMWRVYQDQIRLRICL